MCARGERGRERERERVFNNIFLLWTDFQTTFCVKVYSFLPNSLTLTHFQSSWRFKKKWKFYFPILNVSWQHLLLLLFYMSWKELSVFSIPSMDNKRSYVLMSMAVLFVCGTYLFQLSNGNIVHDIRQSDERYLPDEYTTEAIQALQNMTMNNKQDFLKWEFYVFLIICMISVNVCMILLSVLYDTVISVVWHCYKYCVTLLSVLYDTVISIVWHRYQCCMTLLSVLYDTVISIVWHCYQYCMTLLSVLYAIVVNNLYCILALIM